MVNIYIPYKESSAMYESVDFFQFQKRLLPSLAAEPICLSNVGPMVLFVVLAVNTITVISLKDGLVFNVRGAGINPP